MKLSRLLARWLAQLRTLSIFFILAAMFGANPSMVLASEGHAGVGPNGGRVADFGPGHIELIGGPGYALLVFALSGLAIGSSDGDGNAAYVEIVQNGRTRRLRLSIDEANWLSVALDAPLKGQVSIHVVMRRTAGETLEASFGTR